MRTVAILLCSSLMFSGVVSAAPQVQKNTIRVIGNAAVERKPDICYVTLYVRADGILMVDAVKKADNKVAEIRKEIKEKHKNVKEIEVTEIGLGQKKRRYWSSEQEDESPRPEATKRLRIALPPDALLARESTPPSALVQL